MLPSECWRHPGKPIARLTSYERLLSSAAVIGQNERQQTLPGSNGFRSRLGWRALASAVLFLIIPICFVISVSQLTRAKGPQWLPYTFENSYNYLFNSLLLVQGRAPPYIMHPGTTTQAFGALILRGSSLASTNELVRSTLRSPEQQIKKLHEALLVFTALILWIFPWFTAVLLRYYAVETEPLFIIISSVTVVAVIGLYLLPTEQKDLSTVSWRTALLVFGLQSVSYLIIAKDPSARYLIPLILTSGLSLVLVFYVFHSNHRTIRQAIGWVTLIGLLFLGCKDFVEYMPRTYEN